MPEGEQPLEVLPSGDQQGLGVDPPQGPQAKAAQPMPHLGLRKERLDPHLALPERLAVRLGLGVGAYLLQKLVAWVAVDAAPLGVGGAHLALSVQALQTEALARYLTPLPLRPLPDGGALPPDTRRRPSPGRSGTRPWRRSRAWSRSRAAQRRP